MGNVMLKFKLHWGRVGENVRKQHGERGERDSFTLSHFRLECLNSRKFLGYRKKTER